MEFKGIDWTELSRCFGIINYNYDSNNDMEVLENTKQYLSAILFTDMESEIASVLREFINKLYENSKEVKENAPIWKGLLEIEDDFTLIKYCIILLEHMWY